MSSNLSSNFLQFKFVMANINSHGIYEFDEFRLNVATMMLCRAEKEVSLPPKAVKTLAVLVENKGEIISKDELIGRVWEDSVVEESNLSQNLYLLRKTLGNNPEGRPYIETLRRRGYRFTGKAEFAKKVQPPNAESADTPLAKQRSVPRPGNVIELSQWQDKDHPTGAGERLAATPIAARFESYKTLALVLVIVGLLVAASAAFWFKSGAEDSRSGNGELNFRRLTNGIVVEDATVSPDGKYFVYHTLDNDSYRLWVQQTGQSTRVEVMPASKKSLYSKSFSPDGPFI